MNYGFIGSGNMATAIIKGMITQISPHNIFVYDKSKDVQKNLMTNYSIQTCTNELDLVNHCDVVILSVKPHILQEVTSKIVAELSKKKPLVISIAAGKTIYDLENLCGTNIPIIRVMPNINAQVGESMTAVCGNSNATSQQISSVIRLFDSLGKTLEIPEKDFPAFMAIASCSPAFVYLFVDALAKSAQKLGIPKQQAVQIASQVLLGSSKTLLETNEHPQVLIDKVCSPGGTTIEGICTLQEHGFETAILKAIESCVEKDKRMS